MGIGMNLGYDKQPNIGICMKWYPYNGIFIDMNKIPYIGVAIIWFKY